MIAFSVCYKDKDGFDIFCEQENGSLMSYPTKGLALAAMDAKKKLISNKILHPPKVSVTTGYLWWKRTAKVTGRIEPEYVRTAAKRMYDTMYVKRIKMA